MIRLDFFQILDRMLTAGRLKSASELARVVGVTPQAITNYKKKGEISARMILRFAEIYGVSVDWLITGEGEMYKSYGVASGEGPGESGGQQGGAAARLPGGKVDITALEPDEILYIGKLLKVLRGPADFAAPGVKVSIDAFLKAAYSPYSADECPSGFPPP